MRETALTFVVAPLPNALFSHCGGEEFSTDYGEGSGPIDLGRFDSSPPLSSSLAFHCHTFSRIRKSSNPALVLYHVSHWWRVRQQLFDCS
jgi:hypothetical protein